MVTPIQSDGFVIHWSDVTVADAARLAVKPVRTPSQPAFRPSMEKLLPHAEPEAGALVSNTRFFRTPCGFPPAVT
jgi:hypothetical protein